MNSQLKDENTLPFDNLIENQIDLKHGLVKLAQQINWKLFEDHFSKLYHPKAGRPSKPIRLMVSLLILKHVRNLSDESVVEQWTENIYYQYFSGQKFFTYKTPCEASELVHFRKRIGSSGMELILGESIRINGKGGDGNVLSADTTVQDKNITYPTDDKLYKKIIKKCQSIAQRQGIERRQSYRRTIKKLSYDQRFRKSSRQWKKAIKADRKIKTIAGRLVRELERKLVADAMAQYGMELELFKKILSQKRNDNQKIYSIHEPHVQCHSKGKEHKKYEFGNKVSILINQKTGVIVGAISIDQNKHDSKTLEQAVEQYKRLTEGKAKEIYVDRGYRGVSAVQGIEIKIAGKQKNISQNQRKKHSRRAAIEPKISHLKSDHRLSRNFYKGILGDQINILLAAAAMNFKTVLNKWKKTLIAIFCLFIDGIKGLRLDESFQQFNIIQKRNFVRTQPIWTKYDF